MNRNRLGLILAISWLAAVTISYLIFQQQVPASVIVALTKAGLDIVSVIALMLVGGALGTLLMPVLPRLHGLVLPALRALMGLGMVSLIVLGAGLAGLIPSKGVGWGITLVVLIALYRSARQWVVDLREAISLAFLVPAGGLVRFLQFSVVFLLTLQFVLALAPPTAWDALTYHLAGPQLYLDIGRIVSFPENHFLGFPQVVEMLYLWVLVLARPQAAALLHWVFGVFTLALVLGYLRQIGRSSAGWIAVAILVSGTSILAEFSWSYSDLATCAFVLAAVLGILAASETSGKTQSKMLIWAGMYTGLAVGTKYTAGGAALGIAVLVVATFKWHRRNHIVGSLVLVTATALIVFLPWLIRNLLLDGNPIAPFGAGTRAFDSLDQWYYLKPGTGLGLAQLLILPLQATVFGREALAPYGATITPLLVGLLPLMAVGWRRRRPREQFVIASMLVFCFPPFLVWLVGAGTSWFLIQTRLLYPIFPMLAIAAGLGVDGLQDAATLPLPFSNAIGFIVAGTMALALTAAGVSFVRADPLPVVLGLRAESDYLQDKLGTHYAAMSAIRELPPDSRVLTLWEPRSLYCGERCIPDSMIDEWWHDRQVFAASERIASSWRERGITHVLIFEAGLQFLVGEEPHEPLTSEDIAALDTLRQEELISIWDEYGDYTLYELNTGIQP